MSIITETRLLDFKFWGGAVPVAKRLTLQELDQLEQWLEEDGTPLHAVDINDFFWFETEYVLKAIHVDENTFWAREERA